MKEYGQRIDEWWEPAVALSAGVEPEEWLLARCSMPDKFIRKLKAAGGLRKKGNRMLLHLFPREEPQFTPHWDVPDILYEDDFCLVAAKPAGMAVHPARPDQNNTLANAIAAHYLMTGQACRVRHIHRLDEDTTGPVLYAKNEWAQLRLDEEMRNKTVLRTYLAVVQGHLGSRTGTIDAPIARDRHVTGRRRVSPTGDSAVTHYEVVETYPGYALVRLRLETGRTHQIRVHMSHIGHPLVGDTLYGDRTGGRHERKSPAAGGTRAPGRRVFTENRLLSRQALHGEKLGFPHPFSGETVEVEAPLPEDFRTLLRKLREGATRK